MPPASRNLSAPAAASVDVAGSSGQGRAILPLPWSQWPAEARLLVGLVVLWSLFGLLVLASASWFVADREMNDAAF